MVLLGKYNLASRYERGADQRNISRIIVHPDWRLDSEKWDADLAMLVLASPVTFTAYIQPVCLPKENDNINNYKMGTVVGWGKSESGEPNVNIPREVTIAAVNDSVCFTHDFDIAKISTLRTFCAGGDNYGPCHGDSGKFFS